MSYFKGPRIKITTTSKMKMGWLLVSTSTTKAINIMTLITIIIAIPTKLRPLSKKKKKKMLYKYM